ncbi:uncharacterized protein K452DRAFT_230986 [Aplosporella prunicola CBS 121167]|uniref:PQ-loop repeat-containing protein n=1 Tax=Aplosporella prunicola CBS 121167 TaxID=1176127 RepID=A0A6A6BCK2_9PEZI|nr:uncharacterized protein K452DRAFT_230986 [Aplosporella prunicola CBS 121167]KAF2140201.1 hypothetical protein K452DRAFT_230986 [Aplosporella prunicola CBS 121167]
MGFFSAAIKSIAPIFIMTSPVTSYADQIYSIHKNRSSGGFSLDIPLIMLLASILKIFYWFGAHFALSLLTQAILMIIMQCLLLHVALTHRPPSAAHHTPFAPAPAPRPYNFWQWRPHRTYWVFLAYFTGGLFVLHILISPTSSFPAYTNMLGYLGLAIEATLPLPQIMTNQRSRSTKGFRPSVLLNWLVGDVFKMAFFFLSGDGEVPWAFKFCGLLQACCDAYLGVQWWMFGNGPLEPTGTLAKEINIPLRDI